MPRVAHAYDAVQNPHSDFSDAGLQSAHQMGRPHLDCLHCEHQLECVDQSRRSGTWLGSFICPNCRSEYFYAYRWGRLMRKT